MFKLIFIFFLLFLLLCLFIGFNIMWPIVRMLLGFSSQPKQTSKQNKRVYNTWQQTSKSSSSTKQEEVDDIPNINRRKMFDKNEGEYVDYEEVK